MDRYWLNHYPPGVPADIDATLYPHLPALLKERFERYESRIAFSNFGHGMSYAELDEASGHFAAALHASGLTCGQRIALMMPNLLQYPVALFGIWRAGMIAVNVNPQYTGRELKHVLKDSEAHSIVILENFAHTLEEVLEHTQISQVILAQLGDLIPGAKGRMLNAANKWVKHNVPHFEIKQSLTFQNFIESGAQVSIPEVRLSRDHIALLQYTGGTTGTAKAAMLTHGNLIANILQAGAWMAPCVAAGHTLSVITALPLYHVFSLLANGLVHFYCGIENVLVTNPKDFRSFVHLLKKTPFSGITGVNTLFNALLHTKGFETVDFSHLKISLGGGSAIQKPVADRWKAVTGCTLVQAYGLSETSPAVCINPIMESDWNASVGLPISSTEVSIRDEEGEEVGQGSSGEICVRGPQVMKGYWRRPEETRGVFLPDGWLRTGDIGSMDARGYVTIRDRSKDMILVSGFKVYPNEVEEVAMSLRGMKEAAAVGMPDAHSGEVVKLFVVCDDRLSDEQILQHCRDQLTRYKIPQAIERRSSLPKSNIGKILRRELRESA